MSSTAISSLPVQAVALPEPPTDGISSLRYLNDSTKSLLASSSWDGSVRVHDTVEKKRLFSHQMESGPLLSLAEIQAGTGQMQSLATGGMDGSIRMVDLETSTPTRIGQHTNNNSSSSSINACSCLVALSEPSLLASAGWHKQLHVWDIRQSNTGSNQQPAMSVALPGKAFSMDYDTNTNRIVVACSGRRTCLVDARNASVVMDRESLLKYQLRCVRFFPDGQALAAGSVEGRVGIEYLPDETATGTDATKTSSKKNYAFKCHRSGDVIYPVNCIEFHPKFGTFATGGCDGCVSVWDGLHKKKLTTFPQLPTSISALAFRHDGSEIAIASSYTFEDGEREHPRDEIYIRPLNDADCRPKTSK